MSLLDNIALWFQVQRDKALVASAEREYEREEEYMKLWHKLIRTDYLWNAYHRIENSDDPDKETLLKDLMKKIKAREAEEISFDEFKSQLLDELERRGITLWEFKWQIKERRDKQQRGSPQEAAYGLLGAMGMGNTIDLGEGPSVLDMHPETDAGEITIEADK